MPRYYLNFCEGDVRIEDQDGYDLRDLAAAREEALAEARDILAGYVKAGQPLDGKEFEITDETGQVLVVVPLLDALNLSR